MIKIQIKSIFGNLLFEYEGENNTTKETLRRAVLEGAVLEGADLRGADLRGADLRGAFLRGADLRGADLRGADLRGADLRGADLRGAFLRGAFLRRAVLEGAVLEGADLRGAVLRGADLRGADLRGADLRGAQGWENTDWTLLCKRDILFILQNLKSEVPSLRQSIIDGQIDGTQYVGECACLVGTLGKSKGINEVCEIIPFYRKGLHNFGEQFFLQIRKGDTPENSGFSKIALELCDMVLNSK